MGFVKIVRKPCACQLPPLHGARDMEVETDGIQFWLGTEWQCDSCKTVYILQDSEREGFYWQENRLYWLEKSPH